MRKTVKKTIVICVSIVALLLSVAAIRVSTHTVYKPSYEESLLPLEEAVAEFALIEISDSEMIAIEKLLQLPEVTEALSDELPPVVLDVTLAEETCAGIEPKFKVDDFSVIRRHIFLDGFYGTTRCILMFNHDGRIEKTMGTDTREDGTPNIIYINENNEEIKKLKDSIDILASLF